MYSWLAATALVVVGVSHSSSLTVAAGPGTAAPASESDKIRKPQLPDEAVEIEMALGAAPPYLRKGASVYALRESGYVKVRSGTNGFTCIVNRDNWLNLKPTCYDKEGSETILPVVLRTGELLMRGTPQADIMREIQEGFRTGKYRSPRRPGVAYMLSGEIRNCNPMTGACGSFPPHVMFYAPNLTNSDIGSQGNFEPGLPSIAYPGPQAFMVVVRPQPQVREAALDGPAKQAVRQVLENYRKAWLANDKAGVLGLFAEDAVISPHHGVEPRVGKAAIEEFWFPPNSPPTQINEFELEVEDIRGEGGMAVARGKHKLVWTTTKDGRKEKWGNQGTFLTVLVNRGAGWVITHQMWDDPPNQQIE